MQRMLIFRAPCSKCKKINKYVFAHYLIYFLFVLHESCAFFSFGETISKTSKGNNKRLSWLQGRTCILIIFTFVEIHIF